MAYLLRIAKHNRWIVDNDEEQVWIERGTAPADIAADFATDDNMLSLWRVDETDEHRGNLKKVILALVGNRDNLQHFEYVLFDEETLEQSGVENEDADGEILDAEVAPLHVNINIHDVDGLAHFLKFVWLSPTRIPRRVMKEDLVRWSFKALKAGTFKYEHCKPGVLKELEKGWAKLPPEAADL